MKMTILKNKKGDMEKILTTIVWIIVFIMLLGGVYLLLKRFG